MTTPRAEAIKKSHSDDISIAEPRIGDEVQNKIDHFGVLGRIIEEGTESFLDNAAALESLKDATSMLELTRALSTNMVASIFSTISEPHNRQAFSNLHNSQRQRHVIDEDRHGRIEGNLQAGVETFTGVFSSLAWILNNAYGRELATSADNWQIVDRLSKLHIELFGPYITTYLHTSENIPAFLSQLEPTENGGVQFSPHFPKEAEVSVWTTRHTYRPLLYHEDILLGGDNETIQLKDIPIDSPEIGCPVSFKASTVKRLWAVFAEAAAEIPEWEDERITMARRALMNSLGTMEGPTPSELEALASSDDTEALSP